MMLKVTNIKCHVGAYLGGRVFTTIDVERNQVDMYMNDLGVFVTCKFAPPTFIPHSTICSVSIDPASYEEFMAERDKKKPKAKAE